MLGSWSTIFKILIEQLPLYFQTRAAYKKVMEDGGVGDPNALDKNYWIQRVGEVSTQIK